MLLYHFTAHSRLASIMEGGLSKGDVPVNGPDAPGVHAVWLTADPSPEGNGLGEAREMTEAERWQIFRWRGELPEPGTQWENKRAVRITVKLPSADPRLKDWLPWARKRVDPTWLSQLTVTGGGTRKARRWKLYFGTIPPSAFTAVDVLEPVEASGSADTASAEPLLDNLSAARHRSPKRSPES